MTREGQFAPDFEDEVVAGAAVTRAGRIVHEPTREAIEGTEDPPEDFPDERLLLPPGPESESQAVVPEPPLVWPGTRERDREVDGQLDLPFDQEDDK
jgi:hypothetical protein